VLIGKIKQRLEQLFFEKANELEIEIKDLTVMSDHVHLFIKADPL